MKNFLCIFLLIVISFQLFSQQNLTGVIIDSIDNNPLYGATILIENSTKGTATDKSGNFTVNASGKELRLIISYLGYETKHLTAQYPFSFLRIKLAPKAVIEDEVIVSAIRAGDITPATFSEITAKQLNAVNFGQDLPFLIQYSPSVVATSDAGAGVGYTSMRIRGSDQSRINVTLNGIPLNDSESQALFLVDLPDLASSINDIQIQRGIGTSTNGASSFGASVNITTTGLNEQPYAELNNSVGSFKTIKNTVTFGTGLIKNHFSVDGRLSRISSDGYIDRAKSNLKSYFISAGYYDLNTIVRINVLSGKERTYQAWYGVSEFDLEDNRTFNLAGTDYFSKEEPYENEVDDYKQDHLQLLFSQRLNNKWNLNFGSHYTKGKGYYEQYKTDQSFADYQLENVITGTDTVFSTDLVRRRWLDNDFYGTTFSLNFDNHKWLSIIIGGAWNKYAGDHFGEIIWAEFASNSNPGDRFYDNTGIKKDLSSYIKTTFTINKFNITGDLQYRKVDYKVSGIDIDQRMLHEEITHHFFNPKAGLSYKVDSRNLIYGTIGIGQREPNRDDYIDASENEKPQPEKLTNAEVGYRLKSSKLNIGINGYYMGYKDQLVLTGKLNDVGTPIRTNVEKSFRAGLELDAQVKIGKRLDVRVTGTLSKNKIKSFNEYINTYDDNYILIDSLTLINTYSNTDISFSPELIGSAIIDYEPLKGLHLALFSKYVGKQFLDNTSNSKKQLNAYLTNDVLISYSISGDLLNEVLLSLQLNNITNRLYESNGYTFSERYLEDAQGDISFQVAGEPVIYNYYYPQAGFNIMAGLSLKF